MLFCREAGPEAFSPYSFFYFFFGLLKLSHWPQETPVRKRQQKLFFLLFFLSSLLSRFFPSLLVSLVPFPLRVAVNGIFFVRVFFKVGRNAPAQLTRSWEFADNGYREGGFAKAGGAGATWRGVRGDRNYNEMKSSERRFIFSRIKCHGKLFKAQFIL